MLKFSLANAKTKALYAIRALAPYLGRIGRRRRKVYSLDLSSGLSCPGALVCKSQAVEVSPGKWGIQDGRFCQFRCFSASQEALYPAVREARRHNFECLKKMRGWEQCRDLILGSLPDDIGILRFHVAGDFFKEAYFQGALAAAKERPDVLFYAYSKSLNYLLNTPMLEPEYGRLWDNFLLTASRGGRWDKLIGDLNLREARVVYSEAEAESLGLDVDHDDSHAATRGGSFALLIHGTQPKGSPAAKALVELRGAGSYGRK